MCRFCDIQNESFDNVFSDDDYERIIDNIYSGSIDTRNLDRYTYFETARKLVKGVFLGYGKNIDDVLFASEDYNMLYALRQNVYYFSGAKTYQQTRAVSDLLTKKDKISSFNDFKKQAKQILVDYNENYLRAEYNSAIAQSQAASQWKEIEKDKKTLKMLTYHTVGDGRVRPEHAMLNNITRPVDDNFWNYYFPPNGWNCRCTTLQSEDAEQTSLRGFRQPDTVPDIFMFNAGKERIVYSKKHPYFKVSPKDKDFARTNFDLPTPKDGVQ